MEIVISVRLEGPTEIAVREAAKQMLVTITTVKKRSDCVQAYGHKIVAVPKQAV